MSLGAKLSPSICEIKGTGLNKEQQKMGGGTTKLISNIKFFSWSTWMSASSLAIIMLTPF